jgi:hypothetical protein
MIACGVDYDIECHYTHHMKAALFSILFASSTLVLSAADAPSATGSWQIHNSIAGNESDMACSFTQKDSDLTGTCSSTSGAVTINGKIDGKKVNWTYKSEYNGGPITMTYKGTADSTEKISGSVTVEEYSVDGEFTATKSK